MVWDTNYIGWWHQLKPSIFGRSTAVYAAVVNAFDHPPTYQEFRTPTPAGPHEGLVEVVGAGLHPRVRSQADGSHYTSADELPLVPGIDGIGRLPDGRLVYFVLPDTVMGALAERTVIDRRRSIILPEGADPLRVAAAMNPAMSSWVALRRRIDFQPGQRVLVLGATGSAGQLAIQVARRLGAGRIVAAGRNQLLLNTLPGLGADDVVSLGADPSEALARLGRAANDVDVVIDYVWGAPAAQAMTAIGTERADRGKPLSWIQVGSVAGPAAGIPSAALRAANLRILGSGQGSVSAADILAELPELAGRISDGTLTVDAIAVALCAVEKAWSETAAPGQRVVLCPDRFMPTIQAR
jgi:NADPH:quinone reductase-like Zn-dependent oxidoreductase